MRLSIQLGAKYFTVLCTACHPLNTLLIIISSFTPEYTRPVMQLDNFIWLCHCSESEETFCVCKGRELIEMVFAHMLKMCTTAKSNMKFTNSKTSRSRFYFSFCFREKFIRCIARHWISTSSLHYHIVEFFFSPRKIQCAIETLKLNHINNNVHIMEHLRRRQPRIRRRYEHTTQPVMECRRFKPYATKPHNAS